MIEMITIEKLNPHYQNPRKDLGDLMELADSIKKNGVLQNLTVVPWFSQSGKIAEDEKIQSEMGYIVVIGHRRLAAAKIAGLKEVPCVIADMDQKTQLSTMLLENIQRNDLTLYEQAQGFQMMMDLGETVANICEKTGFAETTIRKRINLMKLDQKKLLDSMERGATLMDYEELNKIKDIETRNKLLKDIGTSNFEYNLMRAKRDEEEEENEAKIRNRLREIGTQIEESERKDKKLKQIFAVYGTKLEDFKPKERVKYFYTLPTDKWGYPYLYSDEAIQEIEQPEREIDPSIAARNKVNEEFKTLSSLAYINRHDFIKNYSNAAAKKNLAIIAAETINYICENGYGSLTFEGLADIFDMPKKENEELSIGDFAEAIEKKPELFLLAQAYLIMDGEYERYYDWQNKYGQNDDLDRVYEFLTKLGYEMSDTEKQLKDGTHPLFVKE